MSVLREWYRRIIGSRRSTDPLQAQVEEELGFHLEMLEQENRDAGLSREAARTAARRRFGDYDLVVETGLKLRRGNDHLRRRSRFLDEIVSDLFQGARALLRNPAFSVAAVLIIAVGIGANTAAFSVANAVLFRPLPLTDADRLVTIGEFYPGAPRELSWYPVGTLNLRSWQQRSDLFEGFAAAQNATSVNLTGTEEPERLNGQRVSTGFFNVLGAPPLAGRLFRAEDGRPGAEPVVLLGERFWRRRFAADPAIVGKTIHLDMKPYAVIGVASSVSLYDSPTASPSDTSTFHWLQEKDFWVPMVEGGLRRDGSPRVAWVRGLARLREGVSLERARAEIERLGTVVRPAPPYNELPFEALVEPVRRAIGAPVRRPLLVLMGAAGLVLLIMCADIANLLVSRTLTRSKEVAVCGALGASRARLARQLLTEAIPLVLIGGGLGLFGAWWMVNLLLVGSPTYQLPRLVDGGVPIDATVAAFALAAVTVTILLCGLPPAVVGSRVDLHDAMKRSGGRTSRRRGHPAGKLLVGFEMALAMVLVTAAGLLTNSFLHVAAIDLGFDPAGTITAKIGLPSAKYADSSSPEGNARVRVVYGEILDEAAALPGVESVGLTWIRPLSGEWTRMGINIEGRPQVWDKGRMVGEENGSMEEYDDLAGWAEANFMAEVAVVSPGYFRAAGVPLIRGEYLTDVGPDDPRAVVISESAARSFFPGVDPIGERIATGDYRGLESWAGWRTVVGIVADVRQFALEDRPAPQIYLAHEQLQTPTGGPSLIVRTAGGVDPRTLADELAAVVQRADPDAAMHGILSLEALLARQLGQRRLYMTLVMVFAGCAVLLATVGVFAVIAYATSRRTHEIGVRRALGARRADAVNLILRQGLGVVVVGVAAGTAGSWALSNLLSGFLYEVEPTDPLTFAVAAIVLLAVAFLACLIPARRAAHVDPIASLRAE